MNPRPHLPFPKLGGYPSSPISWVGRTTVYTQGEAPGIEPNTSSPISRPGRPHPTSHISHYVGFLCIKGKILIRGLIFSYTPLLSYTLMLHVCNRTGTQGEAHGNRLNPRPLTRDFPSLLAQNLYAHPTQYLRPREDTGN